MKKFSILVLISLFLLPVAYAEETQQPVDEDSAINIGQKMIIKATSQDETDDHLKATIKISYPQITGEHLSANATQFNQVMQQTVMAEVQQFKKYVTADLPHMKILMAEAPQADLHNEFQIDYDIDVIHPNHNTIISVRLNIEGMQMGRAHPYHNHKVVNYDLSSGKMLSLANLFKPNTNYMKFISEYSKKELLAKLPDKWMVEKGAKDPKNYQSWNIQDNTLLITFNEYQVAPYASGPQEIEIPFSTLKNIIAPNSVAYFLLTNDAKSSA